MLSIKAELIMTNLRLLSLGEITEAQFDEWYFVVRHPLWYMYNSFDEKEEVVEATL